LLGTVFRMTGRLSVCIGLHYLEDFFIYGWRAAVALDQGG